MRHSLTQYEYLASRPQLVAAAGATVGALALTGLVITLVNEVPVVSWSCSVNGSCSLGDAHKQGKKQSPCIRIDLQFVMACQGELGAVQTQERGLFDVSAAQYCPLNVDAQSLSPQAFVCQLAAMLLLRRCLRCWSLQGSCTSQPSPTPLCCSRCVDALRVATSR